VALLMGQRKDRAGGGSADAGQRCEGFEIAGQVAIVFRDAQLGGRVQVARAAVITKARP
jgi:hypothetical protein